MIFIFLILNIIYLFIAKSLYEKSINPISIYAIIWTAIVLLHESGAIYFYDLSLATWGVIIFSELLYFAGVLVGNSICKRIRYRTSELNINKRMMKKIILILSIPSLLNTIGSLVNLIRTGGIFFITNIYDVYMNSLMNQSGTTSIIGSVLESLAFFAIALSSSYIVKFGFDRIVLLPLFCLVLGQLSSGSRGILVVAIVMFLSQILLNGINFKGDKRKVRNIVLIVGIVFIAITYFRGMTGQGTVDLPYASEFLKRLCGDSKLLYNLIGYICVPIGVLNQFLENPFTGTWGGATFRVFNKLLFNMGLIKEFDDRTEFPTYSTPISSNAGTYLAELIRDFDFVGMFFISFLLGLLFAYSYRRMIKNKSFMHGLLSTVWSTLVILSFFAWYMRIMGLWIIILLTVTLFVARKVLPQKRIVFKL